MEDLALERLAQILAWMRPHDGDADKFAIGPDFDGGVIAREP